MDECCKTCKWYEDEICCNVDSGFRADFRSEYQGCESWEEDEGATREEEV